MVPYLIGLEVGSGEVVSKFEFRSERGLEVDEGLVAVCPVEVTERNSGA